MPDPLVVRSPLGGRVVDLGAVPDPVFAERIMGDGLALEPTDTSSAVIVAPCDGTISKVFPGGHAIIVVSAGGPILVHIGIDTVELKGAGFTTRVADGDTVAVGDPLVEVDLAGVRSRGVVLTTPVVAIEGQVVTPVASPGASVAAGDPLFEVPAPA